MSVRVLAGNRWNIQTGEAENKLNKGDIYKRAEPTTDVHHPEASTSGRPLLTVGLKREKVEKTPASDECRGLLVRSCGHQ